jgi:hypothetical protein
MRFTRSVSPVGLGRVLGCGELAMKRLLVALLAFVAMLAALSTAAAAVPVEPVEPVDVPPSASVLYEQRWAALMADPGFQAMIAAAGEVGSRTSMDGLRNLVAELPLDSFTSPKASSDDEAPGELEVVRQELLDMLIMSSSVNAPEAASTGAQDPVFCSAAFRAAALHPSLRGPYGEFAANPANNFCLPNGPYGNDLCTVVPDQVYVFDFRRACYQHDMGYFWAPLSDRTRVDDQFFADSTSDCTAAHPWYSLRRYACYVVAGVYRLGMLFSGPFYGRNDIPGYSRPRQPGEALPIFRPFVLPGNGSTCNQDSHAWVGGVGTTFTQGATMYPTGVVAAATRIVFDFVNPATGQIVLRHVTNPSRANCVVHHEPEAVSSWNLPTGQIDVYAKFTRWEAVEDVRVLVNQFTIMPGGGGGGGGDVGGSCSACDLPIDPGVS